MDESVNFMQTRRGNGKFNSTMKNYSLGNKQGNYSNYNNSDNFSKKLESTTEQVQQTQTPEVQAPAQMA